MTSPSTSLRYNSQNPETSSRNPRKRPTSPLSLRERSRKKRDAFTDDQRKNQLGIRQRDAGEEGLGLSRIGKEKCLANVIQVDTSNLAIC